MKDPPDNDYNDEKSYDEGYKSMLEKTSFP